MGKGVEMDWDWDYFKAAMDEHLSSHKNETKDLLQLIKECDKIVSEIVSRPTSIEGDRPQDFVVANLVTRAFRLSVSAVRISLSGYSEIVPNLTRTIFEIELWLLQIKEDPVSASLGFLHSGTKWEIDMMEYDFERHNNKQEELGNLSKNLENWKEYHKKLEDIVIKHELSLEDIQRKYKKPNIKKICKDFGREDAYEIGYAFMCGHVHERGFANPTFLDESQEGVRKFIMSPACSGCFEGAVDAFLYLIPCLFTAAEIIDDSELQDKCKEIGEKLRNIIS